MVSRQKTTAIATIFAVLAAAGAVAVSATIATDKPEIWAATPVEELPYSPRNPIDVQGLGAPEVATVEDAQFGSSREYSVGEDNKLTPTPRGDDARMWELAVRVFGEDQIRDEVHAFRVGNSFTSYYAAYVLRQYGPPYKFTLAVNMSMMLDDEWGVSTMIHEYAHVLSLNKAQAVPRSSRCVSLPSVEECLEQDSYLYAFWEEYWEDYGDEAPVDRNSSQSKIRDFYAANEADFVSEYAASHVYEDFAETFMVWVYEDVSDYSTTLQRKIRFFEQFPALVDERDRIRAEFDLG